LIECVPGARLAVVHDALPEDSGIAAQPKIAVLPSRNSTVPVGMPPPPETFAVKTTACPKLEGFTEAAIVTVAGFADAVTCWKRDSDWLGW
jgi:hypothetical protein